jgi:signal transduction histidine kinase
MNSLSPRPISESRPSLERRLPLLISVLLAAVVAIFLAAAYQEMRRASVERATDRLAQLARELASAMSQQNNPRATALARAGEHPAFRQAIIGGDTAVVAATLRTTARAGDSTFVGWEWWSPEGQRRMRTSASTSPRDSVMLASALADSRSATASARSPLYAIGERVYSWTVVPVREGNRTIGYLAEHRRIASSPRSQELLQQITGVDVSFYIASRGIDQWTTFGGRPVSPLFTLPDSAGRVAHVRDVNGRRQVVIQAAVPSTPWMIVLAQPESSITARPREFLKRMLIISIMLLLFGAFGAWLLGRHVTRPLRSVTDASEAVAAGDYSQRVKVAGGAELSRLAETFNTMAERIGDAHTQLAQRNAELQRANQAKASFLAMMSHELRTPLNAIAGYTELMQLGLRGPVTAQQEEDLVRIRRNKDHLLSIITDILSFARADAGHLTLNIQDISVRDALRDASEVMAHQFADKGLSFRVDEAPETLTARADREKLQQVLLNLLTNALRFTEAGGSVVVSSEVTEEQILIHVRDTGIGIPADRLGTIFDPFVQVDASLTRQVGGAGLGLSIARDLTRAMGGTVSVESQPGKGSVFTVGLPRLGIQPADTAIGMMHMSRSTRS